MNKRILITGVGSSIGCHFFAHFCHNTNWDIVGTDSFRHKGLTDRIAHMFKEHPEWKERLTLVTHDLIAPFSELSKKKIGNIDYIVNLASLSDVYESILYPRDYILNNTAIAVNMLELARELKPETYIQISTDETTGPTEKGQLHDEWDSILPSNPYSASKACMEAVSLAYWRTYNVPVIITNTVNNYGQLQQHNKFPVIVQKKVANDEVVQIHGKEGDIGARFYIHSRNFADAVLFILKNTTPYMHQPGGVDRPDKYNITTDNLVDNLELAKLIAKFMGKELKYEFQDSATTRPGHDKFYGLAGDKLKKLGWSPPVSFEESLKEVIKFQTEFPEWIK